MLPVMSYHSQKGIKKKEEILACKAKKLLIVPNLVDSNYGNQKNRGKVPLLYKRIEIFKF